MNVESLWPALVQDLVAAESETALLTAAAKHLYQVDDVTAVAVVRPAPPEWTVVASQGAPASSAPLELVAEALDKLQPQRQAEWQAIPLGISDIGRRNASLPPTALLVRSSVAMDWSSYAASLAAACLLARSRQGEQQHATRLETLLEITHPWSPNDNLETLLNRLAEAATRLFHADRATIFLWDRSQHTLVGRPALGMEHHELRVPDDAGVVGRVVQSGVAERVDQSDDRQAIHTEVDKATGYQTRTILCVPLVAPNGRTLGAFELLNKHDGNFTKEDETGLTEFGTYAAVSLANTQQWEQLLTRHEQLVSKVADQVQMVGDCPAIQALRATVDKVADTDLAILVLGENGTGKEVVAQSLHYRSRRRQEPFVAVNCAALTETLLESELFGHEKGAFTDAHEARPGKFEAAAGGTLFLDEIGDMSLGGQAKLLRVLENKTVVRVGGHEAIPTDVRIVAATNQDLAKMVREKRFREDLYFRITVVSIELPPLRERGEDILTLAEHFLRHMCAKQGRKPLPFTAAAQKRLVAHRWPGNVRELRNLMERIAYLATGDKVGDEDLAFTLSPGSRGDGQLPTGLPLQEATQEFQADYIRRTIEQVRGNVTEAAKVLGVHRSNLYRKMRSLGMEPAAESE